MTIPVGVIQGYIEEVVEVIKQYAPIINTHMVDYFTKNAYVNCVPEVLRDEIEKIGYTGAIDAILSDNFGGDSLNLKEFIRTIKKCTLGNRKDVCLSVDDLQRKLSGAGCENFSGLRLKVFMKRKKSHEVEILSAIVASLRTIGNVTHLVDIGDGKGYLSSLLSLHYKIPVLGIDASVINTEGAIRRAEKLGKFWKGIIGTNKTMLPKSQTDYVNAYNLLYKQVTQFVTEETDFKELIRNVFVNDDNDNSSLGIVGLHTCGNLAPAALRIYAGNNDVKTLCNVSCCYHLLSEGIPEEDGENTFGFPMSKFLLSKRYYLGRIARMLSAQSADRIYDKKRLPNRNIFNRAVLEVLLTRYFPGDTSKQVGRFKSPDLEFCVYVRKALKKLNVDLDIGDDEIDGMYNLFIDREKELYTFNLIRCILAPIIETLILLDRLLYLHECGSVNSYVVQLFDPVISPRCYGIISYKDR